MIQSKILLYFLFAASVFVVVSMLAGCLNTPSCYDNPRNMNCMTAGQLEKELEHLP